MTPRGSRSHRLPEAHDRSFRIGQPGEMAHAGDFGRRNERLAAELRRLVEIRLEIIDMDIERDEVVRLVAQCGDMALDAGVCTGRDQAGGAVLLDLPVEQGGVELL